ncbi:MAG: hypothetical protein GXO19_00525 [Epsilonproteobacteria bacterium]|nr:hypothetical protein [Campylobacterota bacterium]NPA56197.1 hypothetical protein [Campylobacterota bacterium]
MGIHKLQRKLEKIFSHPIPTNLEWRTVENLLKHLGFEVEHTKKGHVKVKNSKGEEVVLIVHNHEINSKDEVTKLRHFLEENGITPQTKLS